MSLLPEIFITVPLLFQFRERLEVAEPLFLGSPPNVQIVIFLYKIEDFADLGEQYQSPSIIYIFVVTASLISLDSASRLLDTPDY